METQEILRAKYNPEGSELRRLQMRMLDILIVVDEICRRHDIPYWIEGGTLLGAVRHGGFIPWDDDLDIALMRKDYVKLLKCLKNELPACYKLQTHETDKHYYSMLAKIRDVNSEIKEIGEYDTLYTYRGIYIDIFSEEPVYPLLSKISSYLIYLVRSVAADKRYFWGKSIFTAILFAVSRISNSAFRLLGKIKKPAVISHTYGLYSKLRGNRDMFFPLSEIVFENHHFKAPNQIDAYLRSVYGNYMELPEESKRGKHIVAIKFCNDVCLS